MGGHVETRTNKDGSVSFRCKFVAGIDARGRRVQGSRTFRCRPGAGKRELDAARRRAEKYLADREAGELADPGRLTVAGLLDQWLRAQERRVLPGSLARYRTAAVRHILPALGDRPLRRLGALDVEGFVAAQVAAGCAPESVRQRVGVLRAALRQAVAWRLIAHDPSAGVRLPRPGASPGRVPPPAELARLVAAVDADPDRALWRVLLFGGLRIGEALALDWSAVDLGAGWLAVARTLTEDRDRRPVVGATTKTGKPRAVAIDTATVAALREHRDRRAFAGGQAAPAGLVWPRPDGGPSSRKAAGRRFGRLLAAAGLPPMRLHDLRHAHASVLAAAGVDPAVIAARLGHAPAVLIGTYAHASPERQRAAVEAAAAAAAAGVAGA